MNGRLGQHDHRGPAPMDVGAMWKGKGKGKKGKGLKGKGKGFVKGKGKGMMMKGKGKGFMMKGQGKGFSKGKGKGKGLRGKGKGKNDGCFTRDHWVNNCPRAYTQGALWQIDEGTEWNDDSEDWNGEQSGEFGENRDWSEHQGALFDDSAWSEDDRLFAPPHVQLLETPSHCGR